MQSLSKRRIRALTSGRGVLETELSTLIRTKLSCTVSSLSW